MSRVLVDGTLLLDPADVVALVPLVRAGAQAFAHRRNLSAPEADALMVLEQGAYAARRSVAGTAAIPADTVPASWVTVEQAVEVLRMSPSYVRRMCRRGALVAVRRGPQWAIDADSVAALVLTRGEAG